MLLFVNIILFKLSLLLVLLLMLVDGFLVLWHSFLLLLLDCCSCLYPFDYSATQDSSLNRMDHRMKNILKIGCVLKYIIIISTCTRTVQYIDRIVHLIRITIGGRILSRRPIADIVIVVVHGIIIKIGTSCCCCCCNNTYFTKTCHF